MKVQKDNVIIEIDRPSQLGVLNEGDKIDITKMLGNMLRSPSIPKMPDQIVVSNLNGTTIATYKNPQNILFEEFYQVNKNGKLINLGGKIISKLFNPFKYFKYGRRLR